MVLRNIWMYPSTLQYWSYPIYVSRICTDSCIVEDRPSRAGYNFNLTPEQEANNNKILKRISRKERKTAKRLEMLREIRIKELEFEALKVIDNRCRRTILSYQNYLKSG